MDSELPRQGHFPQKKDLNQLSDTLVVEVAVHTSSLGLRALQPRHNQGYWLESADLGSAAKKSNANI